MVHSLIITALTSLMAFSPAPQIPPEDTTVFEIDSSAIITAVRRTSGMEGNLTVGLKIDPKAIESFPKVFGTSDPVRYVQSLPGVTTSADFQNGLHIEGCEISQSITKISDVPIYGQGHVLGFFSVFNPGHFKKMTFTTNSPSQFIGGELTMDTADTLAHNFNGEFNLGPISTHFTAATPVGKKSMLTLSARRSFIDIFYKNLLKVEGGSMDYTFYDLNGSYLWKINDRNLLDLNAYYGVDSGNMQFGENSSSLGADWGNAAGNIRWRHKGDRVKATTQIFGTRYFMTGDIRLGANSGYCKDDIFNTGITTNIEFDNDLWIKASAEYYNIKPQEAVDESTSSPSNTPLARQNCFLATAGLGKSFMFGYNWTLTPSASLVYFGNETTKKYYPGADADVNLQYNAYSAGKFTLDLGYKNQFLYMTGLTNCGFPVEFWMPAGVFSDPQHSAYFTLGYNLDFAHEVWSLDLQAYGKRLWNQTEYTGFITSLMGGVYDLSKLIKVGDGYNYGASIMLSKNSGKLTGWISYSFNRSLRHFDDPEMPAYFFPSSHERKHEFKTVATYKMDKWEFGGNLLLSSGLPYTPVTSVYYMNELAMVKYGDFNSKNLSPYFRLDLSASYNFHTNGKFRDGINFSILNATARKNAMFNTLKVHDGTYRFAPVRLIIPVMPSINYFCKF